MAELNLKQIADKLNAEFQGDTRKLIFWYDSDAEFIADIDSLEKELENAKVLKLEKDNQFQTKYYLEREDKQTNYLVYAPFSKPTLRENHLADTIRYSKEFFADRASLLAVDLGINEKYKHVLQYYIKFFGEKKRTQWFYDYEIDNYNKNVIETALMSVLCKSKIVSFEEVVRTVITEGISASEDDAKNKYLMEFKKYQLVEPFWKMCEQNFGYTDATPTVRKLVNTLFVTYTSKVIHTELPQAWKKSVSNKSGTIIAFLDSLMNSLIYKDVFEQLSRNVFNNLNGNHIFAGLKPEDYLDVEIFTQIDSYLIKWVIERLQSEDIEAKLNGKSIPEICKMRRKMHYGKDYAAHYHMLENAFYIVQVVSFKPKESVKEIWKKYIEVDYKIDQRYRYFYYYYDKLENNEFFEMLRELVENIYTNRYLNPLSVAWNHAFSDVNGGTELVRQQEFYQKYVRNVKERVVVIISDAFRYEVGQTLLQKLEMDESCKATITPMQSVVPSYTRFGMSALLPHKTLVMNEDYKILVDGKICDDLLSREQILQSYNPKSKTVQLDELTTMKVTQVKEFTTGQEVIYVYHNQIDARGDKQNTENEVFNACEEAVEEIYSVIKLLAKAHNNRFIITADHGFIYKRDKVVESDKIGGFERNHALTGRRYVVSNKKVEADGIGSVTVGDILSNNDQRIISLPIGSDVFKISGGGQNFVHGGASIQEILIPVIDVKMNKVATETRAASIALISLVNKITNNAINLDFIQSEAVNELYKETRYKVFFISDRDERISNENNYVADKKEEDASKRVFRLKFTFKNKQYDKNQKYYLVAYDETNDLEIIRHEVKMDMAFGDDFGF